MLLSLQAQLRERLKVGLYFFGNTAIAHLEAVFDAQAELALPFFINTKQKGAVVGEYIVVIAQYF